MKKLIKTLFSFLIVNICIFTLFSHAQNNNIATLVDWKTFNAKIKTLSEWKTQTYENYWNKITAIKQSNNQPWNWINKENISLSESHPVRAWFDNGTIYVYSDSKEIYLNPDSSNMFSKFSNISDLSRLKNLNTSKVTNMDNMFVWCYWITNVLALNNWDTSNVTSMYSTFAWCENLKDISWLSNWDTSKVTNMASMFHNCKKLSNITSLGNWNVKNVTNMNDIFYDCELSNISSLNNWDVSNVTSMGWMFARSTSLTDITPLRNWNTSNVTDMHEMFYSCNSLENLSALSNRNTSNVTKMNWMFAYNKSLEDISWLSNRKTKKLKDIEGMFRWCSSLTYATSISDWDTSNVTCLDFIFEWCSKLTTVDLSNRDTSNVTEMYQMFKDCKKLKTIYAWEWFTTDNVKSNKNDIRDSSTELFDWDTELVWWNGTKYNPSHTDKTYARIDTPQTPWYFTKRWTIIINDSEKEISTPISETNRLEYNELDPSEILSNWYSREMNEAYEFAYKNWITTSKNIEKAKMNSPLTRIAMAKMLSYYAINILEQKPDVSKNIQFNDVTDKQNSDYNNAATLAYQLWIMWQNIKNNNFRPNYEVTRAEFATALSRMLYNIEDGKWNNKYYEPHILKLYDQGIINKTNPNIKEKRWYVMLMLMRSTK